MLLYDAILGRTSTFLTRRVTESIVNVKIILTFGKTKRIHESKNIKSVQPRSKTLKRKIKFSNIMAWNDERATSRVQLVGGLSKVGGK